MTGSYEWALKTMPWHRKQAELRLVTSRLQHPHPVDDHPEIRAALEAKRVALLRRLGGAR